MNRLVDYLYNLLTSLDQLLNTFFGGYPDETLSSRLAKNTDNFIANWICLFLHRFDHNHCFRSAETDEGEMEQDDPPKMKERIMNYMEKYCNELGIDTPLLTLGGVEGAFAECSISDNGFVMVKVDYEVFDNEEWNEKTKDIVAKYIAAHESRHTWQMHVIHSGLNQQSAIDDTVEIYSCTCGNHDYVMADGTPFCTECDAISWTHDVLEDQEVETVREMYKERGYLVGQAN